MHFGEVVVDVGRKCRRRLCRDGKSLSGRKLPMVTLRSPCAANTVAMLALVVVVVVVVAINQKEH